MRGSSGCGGGGGGGACGGPRRVLPAGVLTTAALVAVVQAQVGGYGDVQLCRGAGDSGSEGEVCLSIPLRPGVPAKLCTTAEDLPPAWTPPLSYVKLRLVSGTAGQPRPSMSMWFSTKAEAKLEVEGTWQPRGYCRLGLLPRVLCPDCTGPACKLTPEEAWGRPGVRDISLPPSGGCVYVRSLPEGVVKVKATWETTLAWNVPLKVGLGLALLSFHQQLRASVPLHAVLGGSAVIVCISFFVAYWAGQQLRKGVPGVPFSGFFSFLTMVAMGVNSWFRQVVFNFFPYFFMSWRWVLDLRDPIWSLPIGWFMGVAAVLLVAGLVSYGAKVSMDYLSSPEEPEGDVPFTIGEDGRRIDLLSAAPWPQWLLGGILWLLGAFLVLTATNTDFFSIFLFLVVLVWDPLLWLFYARAVYSRLRGRGEERGVFVRRIAPQQYEEQGKLATQIALEQLHRYLQTNPGAMDNVTQQSELRLRRFSAGGAHYKPPLDTQEFEQRTTTCSVL